MRVEDYFANGKRWWVRLHEKGGKRHEMPGELYRLTRARIMRARVGRMMSASAIAPFSSSPIRTKMTVLPCLPSAAMRVGGVDLFLP
jgi:hypothetical protein